ncbi:MAG: ABC transporter permease [Clostridiaceae bacterium]|nr:ABC transporter permease [Clostridiaceae bacterium]
MTAGDIFRTGLRQLLRAKGQSRLTILSVAIGVFSVVLIASCGAYASERISGELRGLGIDGLVVYLKESDLPGVSSGLGAELQEAVGGIDAAAVLNVGVGVAELRGDNENAAILGVGEGIADALQIELLYGRMPDESDIRRAAKVAVVDEALARRYYKRANIVGKTLLLKSGSSEETYRICGVTRSKMTGFEAFLGENMPFFVYVPYTASPGFDGVIHQFAVRCAKTQTPESVSAEILAYLDSAHHTDGEYAVENISGYIDRVERIAEAVSVFLAAVGAVSLVVAGFGVMNNMLSVQALRRREIGILLAVGALQRDILACYLCESVLLCAAGGICGAAACAVLFGFAALFGFVVPIHAGMLLAALGVTAACGVLFGFVPACRAAALEPMDALREGAP